MTVAQFIPVILSLLVLAAHFLRSGSLIMAGGILLLLTLIAVRRPLAARLLQGALLMGALIWVRVVVSVAFARMDAGAPWQRMAVILGIVAAVSLGSVLVFHTKRMKAWYRIGSENQQGAARVTDAPGAEGN